MVNLPTDVTSQGFLLQNAQERSMKYNNRAWTPIILLKPTLFPPVKVNIPQK